MSIRVRIIYDKRGGACFVPHVSLASLFTRAALRAGLSLTLTQGFSPHPRMSFGPELPAGVVALAEPVDVWMETAPEGFLERWDTALPEGFHLLRVHSVKEDAPSLGKVCQAALYWIQPAAVSSYDDLFERARAYYGESVLEAESGLDIEGSRTAGLTQNGSFTASEKLAVPEPGSGGLAQANGQALWFSLKLSSPAQNGIGGWVKQMIAGGVLTGWQDLHIVRAGVELAAGEACS
ncbi:MAG: TIGR03936 family radical SAM-associated protein [Fretibacterium sp.]|nr:TIGR03936 family radical SAM-associated protein [Fretibacterium sp.]